MPSLYQTTPQTGTVSSENSTSLYSNTSDFTTGLVNSSVYSVNGGTGVTVNPTTGNVVVNIGQDVATTADVTFATANISDTTAINNAVINPLTITAVASGVTPTVGYGVGILAQATLTNGSLGSLGRLNWQSGSVSPGDNDSAFNVYTYENGTEYKAAEISTNGAIFQSSLQLLGETSGYVALTAGFTPAGQTYTLPQAYPAVNGYVLVSTTGGAMSWVAGSSLGTVSSITGTANQVIASSPTGAVTLSLPQDIATTSNVAFGGLNVDSGTLYVDSTNNRVGINNTNPQYELHIDQGLDGFTQFGMSTIERTMILTMNDGDDLLSLNYGTADRLQFDTVNQWFVSGNTGINTVTPAFDLDVAGDGRFTQSVITDGALKINGATSGYSNFVAPATGSNLSYTLPGTAGAVNTVLTNNGSGVLSWALPGGGGSTFGNITIAVVDDNTIATTTGNLVIGNSADTTYYPVINSGAATPVVIQRFTTGTNSQVRTLALNLQSTGTPTVGFGNQLEFQLEAQPGNTERAGYISVTSTDLTVGSEDFKMSFGLMQNGAATVEKAYLDSSGNFIADGYIQGTQFSASNIGFFDSSGPFTTSTTTPNQVASTTSATAFRSLKYQYQITSGTAYQTVEIMIIHDGTTAYLNTYSDVRTGANLSTFDADISGGLIRLLVTPTNAVTTYKGIVTAVVV